MFSQNWPLSWYVVRMSAAERHKKQRHQKYWITKRSLTRECWPLTHKFESNIFHFRDSKLQEICAYLNLLPTPEEGKSSYDKDLSLEILVVLKYTLSVVKIYSPNWKPTFSHVYLSDITTRKKTFSNRGSQWYALVSYRADIMGWKYCTVSVLFWPGYVYPVVLKQRRELAL